MDGTHRLRRLNRLLERALELPASERDGWLQQLQGDDAALLPSLRSMLQRSTEDSVPFLQRPDMAVLEAVDALDLRADRPGDTIGPYRLMSELGAGGMATVWLAERVDGVIDRQVALKLPRMGATAALVQRMARERELLAALEHPHIARLYDAGVTDTGRPWLALERVHGDPIDRYCEQGALDVPQRLQLVLQVCDALAHAHARLIVHRDLKPDNILVTPDGQVQLLDFGIGKLLHDPLQTDASLTQIGGAAITPDYASPEQVAGEAVTVATDVYSLGVVLYQLLTGSRPYNLSRMSRAALEEAILGADIVPPSRRVQHPRLARVLRGELDAIVGKAMARRTEARYASVEAFKADLQAWLDGMPVAAQPPSRRDRLVKFMRRNRYALAAVAGIGLSLLAGLAAAVWQAREAQRQAAIALRSLAEAEASFEYASAVLMDGVSSNETVTLQQLVDRAVSMARRSFQGGPVERATTSLAASVWLTRVGRRTEAVQLLQGTLDALPAETDPTLRTRVQCDLGYQRVRADQLQAGLALLDQAIARPGVEPAVRAWCLHRRASAAAAMSQPDDELRYMQAALAESERAPHASRALRAHLLADLGSALWAKGRMPEAEQRYAQAFVLFDQMALTGSQALLSARHNRGIDLASAGQPRRALEMYEKVIAAESLRTPGRSAPTETHEAMGEVLLLLGRWDDAAHHFGRSAELAQQQQHRSSVARALGGRGWAWHMLGRADAARADFDASRRVLQDLQAPAGSNIAMAARIRLAEYDWATGGRDDAVAVMRDVAAQLLRDGGRARRVVTVLASLAEMEQGLGRSDVADGHLRQALERVRLQQGELPTAWHTGRVWLAHARVHRARSDSIAMRDAAAQALEQFRPHMDGQHPWLAELQAMAGAPAAR